MNRFSKGEGESREEEIEKKKEYKKEAWCSEEGPMIQRNKQRKEEKNKKRNQGVNV